MPRQSRRELLVETAIELFCTHGFHATGIDRIIERSGVSKKTMYSYFRTKDELIMAALKQYDSQFRNFFMREVEKQGSTAQQRIMGVFDVAYAWFSQNNFFGCLFINAVGEYSDKNSPIRSISKEFKKMMFSYVEKLCHDAGYENPTLLAKELCLLLEGAIVTAQVSRDPEAAVVAKKIAVTLLENSTPKS